MYDDDILQPLSNDEDILKLLDIYKTASPKAAHIYNYLSNVIKRRTLEQNSTHFTIFTPHGTFEKGTFFGVEKEALMVMYTLEEDEDILLDILKQTKRFDWTQSWTFYSITDRHYLKIKNFLEESGYENSRTGHCGTWWLSKENALRLSFSCPEDVFIAPLEESHVARVNEYWPAGFADSETYIADIIKFGGGYGVFLKSNGLLISWVLHNCIGIGNIQTVPEYMRKGYGRLIGQYISKKIAEAGCCPLGTVVKGNVASEEMFSKLGFRVVEEVQYVFGKGIYQ